MELGMELVMQLGTGLDQEQCPLLESIESIKSDELGGNAVIDSKLDSLGVDAREGGYTDTRIITIVTEREDDEGRERAIQ